MQDNAPSPSFARLLSCVRQGDLNGAGELVVRRFAARLAAMAAVRVGERLRRRVSAEDVAQSVFRTFFRRLDGGMLELRDWDSLWGLLARIAVCRVCRLADHHGAARRNPAAEAAPGNEADILDREPSPADVLIAADLHTQLLAQVQEKYHPILAQILDGVTHEEIARSLGTSLSTVERVHRRGRECLTALLAQEA